jgi:type I restriction enzyme S subunit
VTQLVKLGDVAEFIRGITFKPEDVVSSDMAGSVRCMRTKNVQDSIDLSDVWSVDARFVKRSSQYLRAGDILVSSANSWNLVGKCTWVPEMSWPATFGGFVSVLRARSTQVHARYLYRWFGRQTTSISNLDLKRVLNMELLLPDFAEQQRIAEVLGQADVLLAKRRQSVSLLSDLARSIFLEMFEDDASGYPIIPVGDLAADRKNSIRTGPFGSQLLHGEFVESGVPVLGIDNAVNNEFRWAKRRFITEEKYKKLARYQVFPDDVIITIMGTCGRCAVVPEDIGVTINTKHLCCISLDQDNCLPEFLHSYFLMHPIARSYMQRTAKGAIMSGLNMNIIKAMPVALPPLTQQERYVAIAREVQGQKLRQLRHLRELEKLFESLQVRAFSGEL